MALERVLFFCDNTSTYDLCRELSSRLKLRRDGCDTICARDGDDIPENLPIDLIVNFSQKNPQDRLHSGLHSGLQSGLHSGPGNIARQLPQLWVPQDAPARPSRFTWWRKPSLPAAAAPAQKIAAQSDELHAKLLAAGVDPLRLVKIKTLSRVGAALENHPESLAALQNAVAGRPIWLAMEPSPSELALILRARLQASRVTHRLLLVLQTHDYAEKAQMKSFAKSEGLDVADWDEEKCLSARSQILVSCDPEQRGVFLRAARVCFAGGTLTANASSPDPYMLAAHGCALLYGPHLGEHLAPYSSLAQKGAVRIVNDGQSLGSALAQLLTPDTAAQMALAAWQVVTEGSGAIEQLLDVMEDLLDDTGGRDYA